MKICHSCKRHVRDTDRQCPFCGSGVPTTTALAMTLSLGLAAAIVGCGPAVDSGGSTGSADGTAGSDASSGGGPTSGPTSISTATSVTTFDPDTTAADGTTFVASTGGTESSSGAGFLEDTEASGGVYGVECSIWDQDCADGEKCVPWANNGSDVWNASVCRPVDPDPRADGELCIVESSGVSGIDNCGPESYCFDVDPETLEGTCVAFCGGDENDPSCEPGLQCVLQNEGVILLCLDACDPFGEPCSDERGCVAASSDVFACVRPGTSLLGEPCTQFTNCEAGASCIDVGDGERVCVSPCQPAGDPCEAGSTCQPWGDAGVCVLDP